MATDLYATHANDGTIYPNTSAINSSGPSATDGTELIAVGFNNYQSGRQQALLNYAGLTPTGVVESNTVSQELEAFRKGFAVGPGMYVQRAIYDDPSTNGDRVIMLSEQGILIASYPELTAKVYVGDANNATVAAAGGKFYKSTDASGATPSTSGTYLQLPAQPEPQYLKQYFSSTDFTVSGPSGWATTHASAIPYQTSDGTWWVSGAFSGTQSANSAMTYLFSGLAVKLGQTAAITYGTTSGTYPQVTTSATGFAVYTSINITSISVSFNLELTSKPTWADDFEISWGITY